MITITSNPNFGILLLALLISVVVSKTDQFIAKFEIRKSNYSSISICMRYNHKLSNLPNYENKTWYRLLDLGGDTLCTPDSATRRPSTPFLATAYRGNCSFVDKVDNARSLGASGLLVVFLDGQDLFSILFNKTTDVSFMVGSIRHSDYLKINKTYPESDVEIAPYSVETIDPFPFSSIILFAMATFVVFCGAHLSGRAYTRRRSKKLTVLRSARAAEEEEDAPNVSLSSDDEDEDEFIVTPKKAVILLCVATATLLLIYFFFKYLVIFYIIWFTLCSAITSFQMFDILLLSRFRGHLTYRNNKRLVRWSTGLALSSISIWWAVCRKEWYAWILLDLLAMNLLIIIQKSFVIPNLKGRNVMVDVATGKNSGTSEKLPFALEMPHVIYTLEENCFGYLFNSMLGFGDILLPGIVVCFLKVIDIKLNHKRSVYFYAGMFGYVLGLACTLVSLQLMRRAQPAILYLAPCVLGCIYAVSTCRGQTCLLLNPKRINDNKDDSNSNTSSTVVEVPINDE